MIRNPKPPRERLTWYERALTVFALIAIPAGAAGATWGLLGCGL